MSQLTQALLSLCWSKLTFLHFASKAYLFWYLLLRSVFWIHQSPFTWFSANSSSGQFSSAGLWCCLFPGLSFLSDRAPLPKWPPSTSSSFWNTHPVYGSQILCRSLLSRNLDTSFSISSPCSWRYALWTFPLIRSSHRSHHFLRHKLVLARLPKQFWIEKAKRFHSSRLMLSVFRN